MQGNTWDVLSDYICANANIVSDLVSELLDSKGELKKNPKITDQIEEKISVAQMGEINIKT